MNISGLRKGSATLFYPFWHKDAQSFLVLKNIKGTEENRVRKVDFAIGLSKIFYERVIKKQNLTLFDPNQVPELKASFGLPEFDELYLKAEANDSLSKTVVSATDFFATLITERAETGRYYIYNADHVNSHSSFVDLLTQSNLCMEAILPVTEFENLQDESGEIASCILSAINTVKVIGKPNLYKRLCELAVRALDAIAGLQKYQFIMQENSAKRRRSIGIGYINIAYSLAKQGLKLDSPEALQYIHELSESLQYYSLVASHKLAVEQGKCEYFEKTKYSKGILPIDTYKKDVDKFANFPLLHDWETLRQNILKDGLRNSTLTCIMPSESSSVVSNATNGIEFPRHPLQVKSNGSNRIKILVPEFNTLEYEYLWSMSSNTPYLKMVAVIQKFIDQSISANTSYNPLMYPDNKVPMKVITEDVLNAYKWGIKSLYYHNTFDGNSDSTSDSGCSSGACAI